MNRHETPDFECPSQLDPTKLAEILGAIPLPGNQTRFTVFAPRHEQLHVLLNHPTHGTHETRRIPMTRTNGGYHICIVEECEPGGLYLFELNDGQTVPDPASRFQPDGVHGHSEVICTSYDWTDGHWKGVKREDLVIQEIHLGTFTEQGTFRQAMTRLDELVDLGITGIELMPVNACAGRWNWGYDGVNWFAPYAPYGRPEDMRRFIDAAHDKGLAVFLDVVYNHFGPEGNYLHALEAYIASHHTTAWGDAPNLDHPDASAEIRRFIIANVIAWLEDFHLDGIRVDAIHCIHDSSPKHWVREMSEAVDQWTHMSGRGAFLIAESNVYDPEMLAKIEDGGMGFDAEWCDDFLHSVFAVVRPEEQLSQRTYRSKTDLQQVLKQGFIYEGTVRQTRQRRPPGDRVSTSGLIYSIQNHDFIGNHPLGKRFHQLTSMASQRTAAALLLLSPAIPMIFMGEEFACEQPFSFFVDFRDEHLRQAVVHGRQAEYPQHDWTNGTLPTDPAAFVQSKLGPWTNGCHGMRSWYQFLIEKRKHWIDSGLLGDQNLKVACDLDQDFYAIAYQAHPLCAAVVTRLAPIDANSAWPGDPTDPESFPPRIKEWLFQLNVQPRQPNALWTSNDTAYLSKRESGNDRSRLPQAWVYEA